MTDTHTKGPWLYNPEETHNHVHSDDITGSAICSFDMAYVHRTQEEKEANGYLIAAAPELLEALENMVETLGEGFKNTVLLIKAQAAIKKARGPLI